MSTPKERAARYKMGLQTIAEMSYSATPDQLRDIAVLALKEEDEDDGDDVER